MASVSMYEVAVNQLKHGSGVAIVLADMAINRFTRVLGAGTAVTRTGYARVNPFEESKGNAPSEEVAPHSLNDWENYDHDRIESGDDLDVSLIPGKFVVTWTKHAGYNNSLCQQRLYYNSMGASQDLSVNPFAGSYHNAGDASTYDITGLTAGNWYALGLKVVFNDSDADILPPDSTACNADVGATELIGAGEGISSGAGFSPATPTGMSAIQSGSTPPEDCFGGDSVTMVVSWDILRAAGTMEKSLAGGPWGAAGTYGIGSTGTNRSETSNTTVRYRMKYTASDPETWNTSASTDVSCTRI